MRLGTTIAAVILVGSLNASTAEDGSLTTPPPPTVPPAIGPPAAALEPAARAAVATLATSTEDRTAATPGRRPGSRPTLTINLSAGEGAGVAMVAGAAQLDPAGVFLAPIEDPTSPAAAGTGSTGADLGSSSTTEPTITAGAPPGAEPVDPPATIPVPTGLLTLPAQRLATPTQRVDSVVAGAIPPGSTVTVDIRGRDANGTWTEWIPSTDASGSTVTLPRTSVEVQSRLVLTGPPAPISGDALPGPTVRAITLIVYPIMLPAMPAPTVAPTSSPTTSSPTTTPPASVPTTTPRPTSTTSSRTSRQHQHHDTDRVPQHDQHVPDQRSPDEPDIGHHHVSDLLPVHHHGTEQHGNDHPVDNPGVDDDDHHENHHHDPVPDGHPTRTRIRPAAPGLRHPRGPGRPDHRQRAQDQEQ